MQEQGTGNPGALLQQLQAAQASPRQQALLMRMLQDSVLGAAARDPLAARVLPALPSALCIFLTTASLFLSRTLPLSSLRLALHADCMPGPGVCMYDS